MTQMMNLSDNQSSVAYSLWNMSPCVGESQSAHGTRHLRP